MSELPQCAYCSATKDLVRWLSLTKAEYRCEQCLVQPEDRHRNPAKPEEITEA